MPDPSGDGAAGDATTKPWIHTPVDRDSLRREIAHSPDDVRRAIEGLADKANVTIPSDYDIHSALADALSLGALDGPPEVQAPILRLSSFLFARIPGINQ